MSENKSYLGDGLYATDQGFQIELRTERLVGDHFVALDDDVLDAFFRFIENVRHVKITVSEMEEGL